MARIEILPLRNYQAGTRNWGPVPVGDGLTGIQIAIARMTTATPTVWPLATVSVEFFFECSINGGPFRENGSGKASGGLFIGKLGEEVAESLFTVSLPTGINRQIQGTVIIDGGALRSSATVEVI